MKTKNLILLLIGMITSVSPFQGGAQNPWNYQRTIRVTDSLVEVFEGDGMDTLLSTYTGPVKGSDLYANPRNPGWDLLKNRFAIKNGENFWIDMNTIPGLTEIYGLGGPDPVTLHSNNMLEVWGAGTVTFHYTANGNEYYVSSHVNYFGVTQWDGADLPSETILVVEEGSELSGTLSEEGSLYLDENEIIGVPEWPTYGMWWLKYNGPTNYTVLFEYVHEVKVGDLLDAVFATGQYGNSFTLAVSFDDGTSNGLPYSHGTQYYTMNDNRSVLVETITLSPSTAVLVKGEQLQFTATVLPENATNPDLVWTSSDPEIAAVNQSGLVTALSPGTTTIRATAQDGSGVFGEAIIEVVAPSYQLIFSWGDGGILSALVDGEWITSPAMLEEGTVVNFIAIPSSNYVIKEWLVNGVVVDTTSYELNLEIDRDYEVLVEFKLKVGMDDFKYQASAGYQQGVVSGKGLLQIYNLSGTLILEEQIHGAYLIPSMPEGIYVLRLGDWKKKVLLK